MFSPPFRAPFVSPIASPGTVVEPWYLAGGVALANAVAVYQPIGAASLAASYVNLANPGTYDAAPGVAPTWAGASGWVFNGTSQYLRVGAAVVGSPPFSMIARCVPTTDSVAYRLVCISRETTGATFAGQLLELRGDLSGNPVRATTVYNNGASNAIAATSSGFTASVGMVACAVFAASNSRLAYVDGGSAGTEATSATPAALDSTDIGAWRVWQGGSIGTFSFFAGSVQAVAIYSGALTAAQVLAISTAAAALTG